MTKLGMAGISTLLWLTLAQVQGCASSTREGGSNSNWFGHCANDAECVAGRCLCGTCTTTCNPDSCGMPGGVCIESSALVAPRCPGGGPAGAAGVCLPELPGHRGDGGDDGGPTTDASEGGDGASTMDGGDASDFRDAADASDASDAADTGPISLPTSEILGEEPAFAARAGYFSSEQVWLFGVSGKAVLVSTWPPSSSLSCGPDPQVDYTGYPDWLGRFGPLQFDHSGRYLLFSETLDRGVCPTSPGRTDSRMIAHDMQTGASHVLPARGAVHVTDGGTVLVDGTELYDFVNGNVTRIPAVPQASSALTSALLLWHVGAPLLVAPGIQPMRREPAGFVVTNALDTIGGDLISVGMASNGSGLCGTHELSGDSGSYREAFLLESGGALSPVGSCLRLMDSGLAFVREGAGTRVVTRDGALVTDLPGVSMHGFAHGAAWGIRGDEIVRWDLTTHVLTMAADARVIGCGFPPDAGNEGSNVEVHGLYLPGAEGRTALVKAHCGAIDSDDAGTFALRLDTLDTTVVERADGEHHVYGVTPLASGAFVLTSSMYQGGETTVPPPGSYFRVDEDGQASLVGPVAGVDGVIHSPQSPAMWGHVRVGGGNDVWSP